MAKQTATKAAAKKTSAQFNCNTHKVVEDQMKDIRNNMEKLGGEMTRLGDEQTEIRKDVSALSEKLDAQSNKTIVVKNGTEKEITKDQAIKELWEKSHDQSESIKQILDLVSPLSDLKVAVDLGRRHKKSLKVFAALIFLAVASTVLSVLGTDVSVFVSQVLKILLNGG